MEKRTALVTGAAGFVGGAVWRQMVSQGWEVWGLSRSRPIARGEPSDPTIRKLGDHGFANSHTIHHDLREPIPKSKRVGLPKFDAVIHCAARSSPWGSFREYFEANVVGTQNILQFCLEQDLPKLIYVSSSSIYYRPEDQWDIVETTPLPNRFVNHYARTKHEGELLVQTYPGPWTILRPRAIFGPEDTILLPRIVRAARAGRLPLLTHHGKNSVGDLVYIDNVVDAILMAARERELTGDFNLTNDEPVEINTFIQEVLAELGIPLPKWKVSTTRAMWFATCLEWTYRSLFLQAEPPITRFGVHVFRYSKTFDISKAKSRFGSPRIALEDGRKRTIAWFQQVTTHGT